jgi:hypothetical protein
MAQQTELSTTQAPETAIEKATADIDAVLAKCNTQALATLPTLRQTVVLAHGITQLRKVLDDKLMREIFMPLQGTPLGFVTDRQNAKEGPKEYSIAEVRDCMIEAMIAGFRPVGNEINIISGRAYGAKAGYERKVREYPRLTDLRLSPGVPQTSGDRGALVPFRASWKLDGNPMEIVRDVAKDADGITRDSRIAVRVNAGMGADAIIGKATRKMLKAIYDMISGSTWTLQDGEIEAIDTHGVAIEPTPPPAAPEQDGKRIKMGKGKQTLETVKPAQNGGQDQQRE